jgi:hypothetical protein
MKYQYVIESLHGIVVNKRNEKSAYLMNIDKKKAPRLLDDTGNYYKENIYLFTSSMIEKKAQKQSILFLEE